MSNGGPSGMSNNTSIAHAFPGRGGGAGGRRDGYRTAFGRGIPSRPLHQVVQQAAMFADYSPHTHENQQFMDAETYQPQPEPLETAFHAHIPGQHEADCTDSYEHFRQQ
eukprot:3747803-Rhodomonas_salina.1